MSDEKKSIVVAIIFGVIDVVFNMLAYISSQELWNIVSIILTFVLLGVIFILYFKYKKITDAYEFIKFLLYGSEYNSFLFFPRLKLYMDYLGDINNVEIETIKFECFSDNSNNCSTVKWSMQNLHNKTKEIIKSYNLYTTSELGTTKGVNIEVKTENEILNINADQIKKKCGVQKTPFTFNEPIRPGDWLPKIKITMKMYDAFDFTNQEIVYLYPRNYGSKVKHMEIQFKTKGVEELNVYLHEIKKIKKGYVDESLRSGIAIHNKEDNTISYSFMLREDEINIYNLYYLLINPK